MAAQLPRPFPAVGGLSRFWEGSILSFLKWWWATTRCSLEEQWGLCCSRAAVLLFAWNGGRMRSGPCGFVVASARSWQAINQPEGSGCTLTPIYCLRCAVCFVPWASKEREKKSALGYGVTMGTEDAAVMRRGGIAGERPSSHSAAGRFCRGWEGGGSCVYSIVKESKLHCRGCPLINAVRLNRKADNPQISRYWELSHPGVSLGF